MELLQQWKFEFLVKKWAGKLVFDLDTNGEVKDAKLYFDASGKRVGTKKSATAK